MYSIGHSIKKHTKVNYDLPSLLKTEFLNDKDPMLEDKEVSDELYLDTCRRRAESKLIKAKIMRKIHIGDELN